MGVGLYLQGRYQAADNLKDPVEGWLNRISGWIDEDLPDDDFWGSFFIRCRIGTTYADQPALFVLLHPAGEEVEIIVPDPGQVIVSAKTSTVGPGYHTALCQLLHRLGEEMNIHWNPAGEEEDASHDETGYFFSGNRANVEEEMLLHLKTIASICLENLGSQDQQGDPWLLAIHLPTGHSYSKTLGAIHTPMGPRSKEWARSVVEDPLAGRDLYPWWDDGLTPSFFLGRALYQLWTMVRWRPVVSDDEYDDWDLICDDLCAAYKADPSLSYPWREWAELIDILDGFEGASNVTEELEAIIRQQAALIPPEQPLLGYRRYPVKVHLQDGWSILIPGAMAETWEDATWSAWDGERTVWFSYWSITSADGSPVPATDVLNALTSAEGDPIHHRDGDLIGKAALGETEEEGQSLLNLKAFSAVAGKAAMCNIFYHDPKDRDWAIATWHSLTSPPNRGEDQEEQAIP